MMMPPQWTHSLPVCELVTHLDCCIALRTAVQTGESQSEPLNGMLLSTSSAGLVAFLAGSIGGGGIITAMLLTLLVVLGTLWTMTAHRVRGDVPSFKNMRVVDGTPSEIFLYLMNVKNYPMYVPNGILSTCMCVLLCMLM